MKQLRAQWFHQVGVMYRFLALRTGNHTLYHRAEVVFSKAIDLVPSYTLALYNRGLLYWRELGQPELAIQDFNAIMNERGDALFLRGMAHQAVGNYRAAADDLEAFIESYPRSRSAANAWSQLQSLYAVLDDLPPALDAGSFNDRS
jgi:tetratricopeptide (TPR) repeat protein